MESIGGSRTRLAPSIIALLIIALLIRPPQQLETSQADPVMPNLAFLAEVKLQLCVQIAEADAY